MTNTNNFIGKTVAIRGIGSGVNVGKCAGIDGVNVLLDQGSFFCRSWEYNNSIGSFHSLANGDIKNGSIARTENETIITDAAQVVICSDSVLEKLEKIAE